MKPSVWWEATLRWTYQRYLVDKKPRCWVTIAPGGRSLQPAYHSPDDCCPLGRWIPRGVLSPWENLMAISELLRTRPGLRTYFAGEDVNQLQAFQNLVDRIPRGKHKGDGDKHREDFRQALQEFAAKLGITLTDQQP